MSRKSPKLTYREKWLMEQAFGMGLEREFDSMSDWLSSPLTAELSHADLLEQIAPVADCAECDRLNKELEDAYE